MKTRLTTPLFALVALAAAVALTGCSNDCQRLCTEMQNYWEDCNLSFGDSEAADCKKSFRRDADDQPGTETTLFEQYEVTCRALVSPEEDDEGTRTIGLRARFSCEDMEAGPGGAFGVPGAR